jgi:Domain of unknown function (DUF4936)
MSATGRPEREHRSAQREHRSAQREGTPTSADPVSYYIYYRVSAAHALAARKVVASMLTALEQRTSVSGRLLRRQDEPQLWMEVYESVRDTAVFEAVLTEVLDASGLAALLAPDAGRKTERFVAAGR